MASLLQQVSQQQAGGMSTDALWQTFQNGTALTDLHAKQESPLSEGQLNALTEWALLPRHQVNRAELTTVIGQQVAAGNPTATGVMRAIGSPVTFGVQTGNIRGVIAGAQALSLTPETLTQLADLISRGQQTSVREGLLAQGHPPAAVNELVGSLAALPRAMVVPQTVAAATPVQKTQEQS